MKSTLNIHWKDWCWSWSSNTLATWCEEPTHKKRPWCWERLRAGGEGDDRGQDGWMGSLTQWTWVWASSRRWWRTGKPGVLQSMGSQRVGHNWASEEQKQLLFNHLLQLKPWDSLIMSHSLILTTFSLSTAITLGAMVGCLPQIHMLKPNHQCDGIWRWGLWEI